MRREFILVVSVMAIAGCSRQAGSEPPPGATNASGQPFKLPPDPFGWPMVDRNGKQVGMVSTRLDGQKVAVTLEVLGLPPGVHGVHLHQTPKCELPAFVSAGGHWNWTNKKHGHKNPQGFHAGDLGNLTVGPDGKAQETFTVAAGNWDTKHVGGLPIIIHAAADDEMTDPSGNSGDRIACGVLYLRRE